MEGRLHRFLATAIATLKGSAMEKKLAFAYAETGSEKEAARANGLAVPTAKTYMQRLYGKNGVRCMAHLLVVGFHNVLGEVRMGQLGSRGAGPSPGPAPSIGEGCAGHIAVQDPAEALEFTMSP